MRTRSTRLRLAVWCLAGIALAPLAHAGELKGAVMGFSTYRDLAGDRETCEELTALVESVLLGQTPIAWVERRQIDLAAAELGLATAQSIRPESAAQIGRWLKANILVTGQFQKSGELSHEFRLKIIDVASAGVLAEIPFRIRGTPAMPIRVAGPIRDLILEAAREAVMDSIARLGKQQNAVRVATVLFLPVFGHEEQPLFEATLTKAIQSAISQTDGLQHVDFRGAAEAACELHLDASGMVEDGSGAIPAIADVFVWGEYRRVDASTVGGPIDVTVSVLGGSRLIRWEGAVSRSDAVSEVEDLATNVLHVISAAETGASSSLLAEAVANRMHAKACLLIWKRAKEDDVSDGERLWSEAVHLLEAARLFAPESPEIWRELLLEKWDAGLPRHDWYPLEADFHVSKRQEAWNRYLDVHGPQFILPRAFVDPTGTPTGWTDNRGNFLSLPANPNPTVDFDPMRRYFHYGAVHPLDVGPPVLAGAWRKLLPLAPTHLARAGDALYLAFDNRLGRYDAEQHSFSSWATGLVAQVFGRIAGLSASGDYLVVATTDGQVATLDPEGQVVSTEQPLGKADQGLAMAVGGAQLAVVSGRRLAYRNLPDGEWRTIADDSGADEESGGLLTIMPAGDYILWARAGRVNLIHREADKITDITELLFENCPRCAYDEAGDTLRLGVFDATTLCVDDDGFWIGGTGGLVHVNPRTLVVETWFTPPPLPNGNTWAWMRAARRHWEAATARAGHPVNLAYPPTRLAGEVTAVQRQGDHLWVATVEASPYTWEPTIHEAWLYLMHRPSRQWVGRLPMPSVGPAGMTAASADRLWVVRPQVGVESGFFEAHVASALAIPETDWVRDEIRMEEIQASLATQRRTTRAMFAFYNREYERAEKLLLEKGLTDALPEELIVAIYANDELGLDRPEQARRYWDEVRRRPNMGGVHEEADIAARGLVIPPGGITP